MSYLSPEIKAAFNALLASIERDHQHGDNLSRTTLTLASTLRIVIYPNVKRRPAENENRQRYETTITVRDSEFAGTAIEGDVS